MSKTESMITLKCTVNKIVLDDGQTLKRTHRGFEDKEGMIWIIEGWMAKRCE